MKPKIFFIDDEIEVLESYFRLLKKEYDIEYSDNPIKALELIKEQPNKYEVVISDFRMPDMDGAEFLENIKTISPYSIRMLLTGYADTNAAVEAVNKGEIFRFIHKPCEIEQLKTHLKNAIKQFSLLNSEREINNIKSTFYSMISHEYKNPLSRILLAVDLLETYYKTQNETAFFSSAKKVRGFVHEMNTLLEDVMQIGRFDYQTLTEELVDIDLAIFLNDTINSFNEYSSDVKVVLTPVSNQAIINSKEEILHLIFNNLISNAIKYSKSGGIVNVSLEESAEYFKIKVKDNGIGIADDDLKKIFDPFFRTKESKSKSGTGLGLTIVKNALNSINGKIEVESVLNQGAEFLIYLPKK